MQRVNLSVYIFLFFCISLISADDTSETSVEKANPQVNSTSLSKLKWTNYTTRPDVNDLVITGNIVWVGTLFISII